MAGDIHTYLKNDFQETLDALEIVYSETDPIDLKKNPELIYYKQMMDNSKILLLYKLRSVYNAFRVAYGFELEVPEKFKKEFLNIMDPVRVDVNGKLEIVEIGGGSKLASEIKQDTILYYDQQKVAKDN